MVTMKWRRACGVVLLVVGLVLFVAVGTVLDWGLGVPLMAMCIVAGAGLVMDGEL